VAPLGELFPEVVHSGKVDRAALSARLLADPKNLGRIEAIVHPLVRRRMRQFFADAAAKNLPLAVADVPLLFETGYDGDIDAVLVTAVDENTMRQRALARPGMTVEKLDAILARQMPQAEKKRRAGYVVDTGRPIRDTAAEVEALIDKLSGR
jgi:dephospho-CoA kinase